VRDLVAAIPNRDPKTAIDLGCGPGNSTEVLADAFPEASITGIDNSSDMIAAARKRLPSIRFELADIVAWSEQTRSDEGPFDLIFSNAVFQWVEGHEILFPRFLKRLTQGGNLAIQMPDNADVPAHRAMREIAKQDRWAEKLAGVSRPARHDVLFYYDLLKPQCERVDIWRTTYHHVITGGSAGVVEWFKGSALRPYLTVLDETEQKAFLAQYSAEVEKSYPARPDGTVLLPFPRLFFVATR